MPRSPANEMRCIDFQPAPHATVNRRTRCVSSNLPSPPTVLEGATRGAGAGAGVCLARATLTRRWFQCQTQRINVATRLGVAARPTEEESMRVAPNVPFGVMPEQRLT